VSTPTVDRVLVVIPVRDEATLLGRQLTAVSHAAAALRRTRPDVEVTTTVVLDSCTDRSPEVAQDAPDVHCVATDVANVGAARAFGIAEARQLRPVAAGHTWVACSDADSEVPAHWLTAQLALAARGFDLVVGTVWPDPSETTPERLLRWWSRHTLHDDHPHVHGANLGFRLSSYDAVGGFRALVTGEDVDLVDRMRDAGVPWTAASRLPVLTSGRLHGRAPAGFADYLLSLGP
jgi:GT2 family glycosyltransferase